MSLSPRVLTSCRLPVSRVSKPHAPCPSPQVPVPLFRHSRLEPSPSLVSWPVVSVVMMISSDVTAASLYLCLFFLLKSVSSFHVQSLTEEKFKKPIDNAHAHHVPHVLITSSTLLDVSLKVDVRFVRKALMIRCYFFTLALSKSSDVNAIGNSSEILNFL